MSRNIQYILLVFVLCFGIKAQAQQINLKTVNEELELLQGEAREKLDFLLYSTPPKLFIDDDGSMNYIWNQDRAIESVEVFGKNQFTLLTNETHATDFRSAKVLILRLYNNETFEVNETLFNYFTALNYIIVQYESERAKQTIVNQMSQLKQAEKFRDVTFLLDKINKGDDYEE
ncbi:hypothetical protein [Myroides sp. WP-1]|uniref:hypothetical protein n=1 Tax=Myroides sp. WP-1 TaxID=2759944 RepID=UPI0015F98092|nr:hypothetical protein [Myroides sp. WP-1]MBB1140987.1 hypothetical protein [Myroides sp. WP-1]